MAGIYLDTSAIGRVLLAEPDARAIREVLAEHDAWWSSELLVVELRRFAVREGLADAAEKLLDAVRLAGVDSATLQRALGWSRGRSAPWTRFISKPLFACTSGETSRRCLPTIISSRPAANTTALQFKLPPRRARSTCRSTDGAAASQGSHPA